MSKQIEKLLQLVTKAKTEEELFRYAIRLVNKGKAKLMGDRFITKTVGNMRVIIQTIKIDGIDYKDNEYSLFVSSNGFKHYDVLSPSLIRFLNKELTDEVISMDNIFKLIEKYNLKKDECFWISDKFNLYAGTKKIKIGKFLKELNLDKNEIDEKITSIEVTKLIKKGLINIGRVNDIYNSEDLKITSCMVHNGYDLSIYDVLDVKVIYLTNDKGEILSRSLLWEGKYFDRVYSTSDLLKEKFTELLIKKGYKEIPSTYVSKPFNPYITEFIPYMDTLQFVIMKDGFLHFSKEIDEGVVGKAIQENGYYESWIDEE